MKKLKLVDIVFQSILAAIYVALTIIFKEISFGIVQFRISELLVVLVLLSPKHLIGVTLGCLISNAFSPVPALDMPIGTGATLLAGLLMILFKRKAWTIIFPTIVNGFAVGTMLHFAFEEPFWMAVGSVALGEFIITVVFGLPIYFILNNSKEINRVLGEDPGSKKRQKIKDEENKKGRQ